MMGPIQPLAAKPGGKITIYVRRIKHYENQKDEKSEAQWVLEIKLVTIALKRHFLTV